MSSSHPLLTNVDIRLLRVFCAVVECGGFSAAQTELNVSRSTISTHMGNLETRLGMTLCRRGRAGFDLTSRGRVVYEASRALLNTLEGYNARLQQLREEIVGDVIVGIIDSLISSQRCKLDAALKSILEQSRDLRVSLLVAPPDQLEEMLGKGQVHLAILPKFLTHRSIEQKLLFVEIQKMYCGEHHPFFQLEQDETTKEDIARQGQVSRAYQSMLTSYTTPFDSPAVGVSNNMEGLAHFILSGNCLGFLPDHYAETWTGRKKMRAVRPDLFELEVMICLARIIKNQRSLAEENVFNEILAAHD